MCGVAGILTRNGRNVSESELGAMTQALAHRGPHGSGQYASGPIGLGHRRLAVLDLAETGNQPMSFAGGRYWITHNGEIYNFLEIKATLQAQGHRFRGDSDTEVILAAYAQWGEACQLRFNGMWAFAIWDAEERHLFLSRDRFGVKPLFYYFDGSRFAFASEMKAFLVLPWFPATFHLPAVACALESPQALESTDHCVLEGLRRLRAGHSLTVVEGGEPKTTQWWCSAEHLERPASDFAGQVAGFGERFLDAVRLRMRSDVPLACTLSGGLDSSSVLCTMERIRGMRGHSERLAPARTTAFVASYPGTSHDETAFAREMVRHTGVAEQVVDVDPGVLPEVFDDFVFQCEEVQSPHIGPWLLYREMSKAGIRVSLDGHGGDELLAGYVNQVRVARDAALLPLPKLRQATELTAVLRRMCGDTKGPAVLRDWQDTSRRFAQILRSGVARRLGRHPKPASPGTQQWLRVTPSCNQATERMGGQVGLSPLMAYLYGDFHIRALPTILRDFDRFSMGHGVEVRSPFLDWRLVCYCLSLPPGAVLGGGYTKRILREAMRGVLPESVRTRGDKIPYKSPLGEWWRGPLLELVRDTVNSNSFLASEIWDGPAIRQFAESSAPGGRHEGALHVFRFVVAHRLMELFKSARARHLAAANA
jgi:asparagine synthase (glutamine-hydrolysing)